MAGPLLVVAARAKADLPPGLKDSKLLTWRQREDFYKTLVRVCDIGEGWVTAAEINKFGLAKCFKLGVRRAITDLGAEPSEEIIMDGIANYIPKKFINRRCEAKADNNYPIVSAASIIAKVKRDNIMHELAQKHTGYGFESHVGYGTKAHYLAIKKLGPLKFVHRTNFAPFLEVAEQVMKTTEQGRLAEAAVAERLKRDGYKIISTNWRTRVCEIDVIAQKDKIVHFIEVKYRASEAQGDGFEYITPRKLKQMNFAAENWINEHNWTGDYCLLAAAVSGPDNEQIDIIEI